MLFPNFSRDPLHVMALEILNSSIGTQTVMLEAVLGSLTLNPKPEILNPKPKTQSPKP